MYRICVINPNYYKSSGVTKVIESLYFHFVKNNKDLSFYFIDCSYGDEKTSTKWATNKNVNELKLMSINPFLFISELIRFKKFVQENNIQLVHVHHRRLVIILTIFKFYLKIPLLYTSHLTYPKNIIFKLIAQLSCIAISESVESNLYETTSSKDITLLASSEPNPQF